MPRHTIHHFTLPELLTSIGIVALLAALLLPAISNARGNSRSTACLSLMRQYAAATSIYADENDDYFPDVRNYLLPANGFFTCLSGKQPDENLTRCPGDDATDVLGRLGICTLPSGKQIRISIGGTSNLTDSFSQTSQGYSLFPQARFMPQNRYPDRRCLWTDYQNQNPDKHINGAALDIWKGTRSSPTLYQYVFRHPINDANGAFADGHAAPIRLKPDIRTLAAGHDLHPETPWTLPSNTTYPYGPRQLAGPGGTGDITSIKDTPSVQY